ncbi:MAG TPA: ATP-binding protein [Aggregatilineales bacterium]|nr:ATP-binding protein [Aggregatilineales bacterium]
MVATSANTPPKTQFAPAERASQAQIEADYRYFEALTMVRTMLDAVPDIVLVLNQQRQVVFANKAAVEKFDLTDWRLARGLRPGELLRCIHASEQEGGCGTTEFCRTCGAVTAILSSLGGRESVQECQVILADDNALELEVSATPLEVNGTTLSTFAVKDVSSEKRRRALERIFFHDILNTADSLSVCAEVLKMFPDEQDKVVGILEHSTRHLIAEIKAQKNLQAAEDGELLPEPAPIDVQTLVHAVASEYIYQAQDSGRTVRENDSAGSVTMRSDGALIERVIGNMVKNALEASNSGEVVTVSYNTSPNSVTFAVHNPAFIPRRIQLQIFRRSFSTKGSGRGLGTHSMRLLTERYLYGRVWFESTPEAGTTFYASYPLAWPGSMLPPLQ